MINPYVICYLCPKCEHLQIVTDYKNFGTTDKDLDGKTVVDAYRLVSRSNVPQDIIDLLKPDLRCKSCQTVVGKNLTIADFILKRPELLEYN